MVYKCCVVDCQSNCAGEEQTTVFSFPKEEVYVKYVSGSIGVKILEVVDWSQVSNQPSQVESVTVTRISRS